MRRDQWIGGGLILTLIVLVGVGLWKTSGGRNPGRIAVVRQCRAVMGTDCTLVAVVPFRRQADAEALLAEAETTLRAAEARMSTWLADSELGRLNAAAAGKEVPLSPQTLEVLRAAREAHLQTGGAFDVTCRPLIELWRHTACEQAVAHICLKPWELAQARARSNWQLIRLTGTGAVKRTPAVRLDLGGIAKGYAIDRAAEVLRAAGVIGGMVDVGGDLLCFGRPLAGETWPVDVKNPSAPGRLVQLRLREGAVCTSGNYARFTEIAGKRYSHIIDPRTGWPAETALSVTVVAPTAMTADIWATALSVLGPEGFERLPEGVEALMVFGNEHDRQIRCTTGMCNLWHDFRPLALLGAPEHRITHPLGP